jgi:hypothetical protein
MFVKRIFTGVVISAKSFRGMQWPQEVFLIVTPL